MKRVVITGAGVVSPNGMGMQAFSSALEQGKSGLKEIDLFDAGAMKSRIVGQITTESVMAHPFEAIYQQFPELAEQRDRKLHFGALAFFEAIDGIDPSLLRESALILGTSLESFHIEKLFDLSPGGFDIHRYREALDKGGRRKPFLQTPLDFLGRQLLTRFGMRGPCLVNCSACTASTQALGTAFQMISSGRAVRVIAGGMDSMLNPLGLGGFSVLGALSTQNHLGTGAIRPFDLWREGTVLGEGAAIMMMESLDSALYRGAEILAEVKGYASTFDAYKLSEPDPEGRGIAMAMTRALSRASLTPDQIDYISAHGTGTPLNDRMETAAIRNVFGHSADSIPVSSVKSMIGHLIGASGAVEVAALLCMLKNDFIAPTINLDTPDPECDLDYVPNVARRARLGLCLKNSMGFGGQNASLVLGRYEQ